MSGKRGVVLRQGMRPDDAEDGPGAAGQLDADWLAGFDEGRAQTIATFLGAWNAGLATGATPEELCAIAQSHRGASMDEIAARLTKPACSRH